MNERPVSRNRRWRSNSGNFVGSGPAGSAEGFEDLYGKGWWIPNSLPLGWRRAKLPFGGLPSDQGYCLYAQHADHEQLVTGEWLSPARRDAKLHPASIRTCPDMVSGPSI
jgi:hypothetical protein